MSVLLQTFDADEPHAAAVSCQHPCLCAHSDDDHCCSLVVHEAPQQLAGPLKAQCFAHQPVLPCTDVTDEEVQLDEKGARYVSSACAVLFTPLAGPCHLGGRRSFPGRTGTRSTSPAVLVCAIPVLI